jgi:trk system potassium uptake protein
MKILVVGDTNQAIRLATALSGKNREVTFVSSDRSLCNQFVSAADHYAVHGDGSHPDILMQAGIRKCDGLVAVSDREEECLVICEVALRYFSVRHVVAVATRLRNVALFREMGINCLSGETPGLEDVLASMLTFRGYVHTVPIGTGLHAVMEVEIASGNPWIGKPAREYPLPEGSRPFCLMRGDEMVVEDFTTRLMPGDHVMALVRTGKTGEKDAHIPVMVQTREQ